MVMHPCDNCPRPHTITLTDGATCCSQCESFRAECEARFVLAMPTKADRRRYLDGDGTPRRKGVRGMRGDAAVTELENLAKVIWQKNRNS